MFMTEVFAIRGRFTGLGTIKNSGITWGPHVVGTTDVCYAPKQSLNS